MLLSMFRTGNFDILVFLYSLLAILVAISFHEYAHALTATRLGDDTPRLMGRLTIAPMKHIDPIGFISLMLVGWGWAKPVTINPGVSKTCAATRYWCRWPGRGPTS